MHRRKEFYSAAHRPASTENRGEGECRETVHHFQEQTEEMFSNQFHGYYRPVVFIVLVPLSLLPVWVYTLALGINFPVG